MVEMVKRGHDGGWLRRLRWFGMFVESFAAERKPFT